MQVVLVIMALHLHEHRGDTVRSFDGRYFYSLVLSVASIIIAIMLLAPLDHIFRHYPLDLALSVAWFVAFAFLFISFQHTDCNQSAQQIAQVALGGTCNTQRATWGFAFLGGCFWLGNTILGCWVSSREKKLKRRTVHTISTPA